MRRAVLKIGSSLLTVKGGFGERYDLQFGFAPLDLADLLADASGRLQGGLSLRGPAGALSYQAKLEGRNTVRLRLPMAPEPTFPRVGVDPAQVRRDLG